VTEEILDEFGARFVIFPIKFFTQLAQQTCVSAT